MGMEFESKFWLPLRKSENSDICYHPRFVYVELRAPDPTSWFLSSFESRDLQVGKKIAKAVSVLTF